MSIDIVALAILPPSLSATSQQVTDGGDVCGYAGGVCKCRLCGRCQVSLQCTLLLALLRRWVNRSLVTFEEEEKGRSDCSSTSVLLFLLDLRRLTL